MIPDLPWLIQGETVVVERRERSGTDPGNNPIYTWVAEDVDDVLVAPGPAADVVDAIRPDGVEVRWNLSFPKGYPETLRGARIRVRGGEPVDVIGDPRHYPAVNTPTRWSMRVEIGVVHG